MRRVWRRRGETNEERDRVTKRMKTERVLRGREGERERRRISGMGVFWGGATE